MNMFKAQAQIGESGSNLHAAVHLSNEGLPQQKSVRQYTEQDIIELFNGDQTKIFQLVADCLNLDIALNLPLKIEIKLMELDAQDAEQIKQMERDQLCEETACYDRDPFGLKRACGWFGIGNG
jgi:hypothetical protein